MARVPGWLRPLVNGLLPSGGFDPRRQSPRFVWGEYEASDTVKDASPGDLRLTLSIRSHNLPYAPQYCYDWLPMSPGWAPEPQPGQRLNPESEGDSGIGAGIPISTKELEQQPPVDLLIEFLHARSSKLFVPSSGNEGIPVSLATAARGPLFEVPTMLRLAGDVEEELLAPWSLTPEDKFPVPERVKGLYSPEDEASRTTPARYWWFFEPVPLTSGGRFVFAVEYAWELPQQWPPHLSRLPGDVLGNPKQYLIPGETPPEDILSEESDVSAFGVDAAGWVSSNHYLPTPITTTVFTDTARSTPWPGVPIMVPRSAIITAINCVVLFGRRDQLPDEAIDDYYGPDVPTAWPYFDYSLEVALSQSVVMRIHHLKRLNPLLFYGGDLAAPDVTRQELLQGDWLGGLMDLHAEAAKSARVYYATEIGGQPNPERWFAYLPVTHLPEYGAETDHVLIGWAGGTGLAQTDLHLDVEIHLAESETSTPVVSSIEQTSIWQLHATLFQSELQGLMESVNSDAPLAVRNQRGAEFGIMDLARRNSFVPVVQKGGKYERGMACAVAPLELLVPEALSGIMSSDAFNGMEGGVPGWPVWGRFVYDVLGTPWGNWFWEPDNDPANKAPFYWMKVGERVTQESKQSPYTWRLTGAEWRMLSILMDWRFPYTLRFCLGHPHLWLGADVVQIGRMLVEDLHQEPPPAATPHVLVRKAFDVTYGTTTHGFHGRTGPKFLFVVEEFGEVDYSATAPVWEEPPCYLPRPRRGYVLMETGVDGEEETLRVQTFNHQWTRIPDSLAGLPVDFTEFGDRNGAYPTLGYRIFKR